MEFPRRIGIAVAATVVVLVGGAYVADTVVASRAEVGISERIRPATPGVPAPAVTLGGGPAARWSGPEAWPSVTVRAEGVVRPVVGAVTVEAEASDVTVPQDEGAPPTAAAVTVSVHITGDALGRALGMRDMLVSAADDPSLAGGTEHRARVTGTVPDGDDGGDGDGDGDGGSGAGTGAAAGERISVFVDLVVDGDRAGAGAGAGAHLVPVAPATGPAGVADQDTDLALTHAALTLPADLLPLGLEVETLTIRGGTLTATGTTDSGTTPLDDLVRPAH